MGRTSTRCNWSRARSGRSRQVTLKNNHLGHRIFFVQVKLPEIRREKELAEACGYGFVVGVRSRAHKQALLRAERNLKVVIMDWC
ncbi:DUF6310 domain-containing protein [Archangium violaceum]|uniref:DUF6310 domain-containing protein n=1 Tax=Archangium violaceum TaxID=83451 RepID=UPI0037BF8C56